MLCVTAYIDCVQSYGPQGIQQQGREVEVREEDCGSSRKHRQGARGQKAEARSSECQWCNVTFVPTRGATGKFCSLQCMYDHKARGAHWLQCSSCMAKLGLGMAVVARMFRTSKQTVLREWRRAGIRSAPPMNGGWRQYAKICGAKRKQEDTSWHSAYFEEYRPSFFDWSSIAHGFMQNLRYHRMDPEEKLKRNKELWLKRLKKMQFDAAYKDQTVQRIAKWKRQNQDKVNYYARNSLRKRKEIDPGFKIRCNLRSRFSDLMCNVKNGGSKGFNSLIGCSTHQLAIHLESTFKRGMTWKNYGTVWHVDHIIPCSAFDHADPKQRAQCWHWTNLRALYAKENLLKSNKIVEPQMNLLLCSVY